MAGLAQIGAVDRVEERDDDLVVEGEAGARQHARSQGFENRIDQQKDDREDRQGDERRNAAAVDDPVVDLQHVQRADKHQKINEEAEDKHRNENRVDFFPEFFVKLLRQGPIKLFLHLQPRSFYGFPPLMAIVK